MTSLEVNMKPNKIAETTHDFILAESNPRNRDIKLDTIEETSATTAKEHASFFRLRKPQMDPAQAIQCPTQ